MEGIDFKRITCHKNFRKVYSWTFLDPTCVTQLTSFCQEMKTGYEFLGVEALALRTFSYIAPLIKSRTLTTIHAGAKLPNFQ